MTRAPCEMLQWDSQFFGYRIARMLEPSLKGNTFPRVARWCADNRVQCLYVLTPMDDTTSVLTAESSGMHLADVRMVYQTSPSVTDAPQSGSSAVRLFRAGDLPHLVRIAEEAHTDTRFYADPHFPREKCRELYRTWIAKSCTDGAGAVFVAEQNSMPRGYVTCEYDPVAGKAGIGLVAVDGPARGRGLGRGLVETALAWFKTQKAGKVTVVTQGKNIGAQKLYQRCGFKTQSVSLYYHWWRP